MFSLSLPASRSRFRRLIPWLPLILFSLLYYSLAEGSDIDEARVSLRYLLFAWAGLVAFLLPYISFPDQRRTLYQLANLPVDDLLASYLTRHRYLLWGGGLLLLATAWSLSDPVSHLQTSLWMTLQGGLLGAGIYLYGAARYLRVGTDSQYWQESERGREMGRRVSEITKYPVDSGSLPSLLATIMISLLGMLSVVAGAMFSIYGGLPAETIWSGAVALFGFMRFRSLRPRGDRWYYQTQAFFGEFFGSLQGADGARSELKEEQLWWIPYWWRAGGWGLLLQMDRKLPAGRTVAAGHLFIWFLAYRGAEAELLLTFWFLLSLLHHGFLFLTALPELAPVWWLRLHGSPVYWGMVRFWIQFRWVLPLMLSMSLMRWLFPLYGWADVVAVVGFYLVTALIVAFSIAYLHERNGYKQDV